MIQGPGSRPQRGRYSFELVQRETPSASGFNIYCRAESTTLLIDPPTSSLGSGTVYLPTNFGDGDVFKIICSKSIIALTYATLNGATVVNPPGSLGYGGKHEFVYNAATNSWYCLSGFTGKLFNQPKIGNFSWVNQGSVTAVDGPSALEVVAPAFGTTGTNVVLLVASVPAQPFSMAMVWQPQMCEWGSATPNIGIVLRNSSNGRFVFEGCGPGNNLGTRAYSFWRFTNPTTFSATIQSANAIDPISALRFDVSGSNIVQQMGSQDGWNWRNTGFGSNEPYGSFLTAAGGSVDQYGFGFYTANNWCTYSITSFGYWV